MERLKFIGAARPSKDGAVHFPAMLDGANGPQPGRTISVRFTREVLEDIAGDDCEGVAAADKHADILLAKAQAAYNAGVPIADYENTLIVTPEVIGNT